MSAYRLSTLTVDELQNLHDTLEHLGNLLLQLRRLGIARHIDLEKLLIASSDELLKRAMEDAEYHCERAVKRGLLTKTQINGETYYVPTGLSDE
jgi:hypothetical protein